MSQVPPNFSWCEKTLAACAFPDKPEHLRYLTEHNVACIVSLTSERDVNKGDISDDVLTIVPVPIKDYTPPTMSQVEDFLACVRKYGDQGKAVCVHCAHGLGRTGTMLGCYYAQTMKPEAAIKHVRQLRPGSIETPEQEALVHQFYDYRLAKGKA
ncbi:dual specificity protein phosphatase 23 [Aplysia californica]|uniref:Dual specificity protein phosphatase 23 n=1 Tax=Aplysia californica TaxID=6500 RepID=A0ABM0JP92_APLCA|nr:dual specificity protein phosphatase 23 [Aplysia californica]